MRNISLQIKKKMGRFRLMCQIFDDMIAVIICNSVSLLVLLLQLLLIIICDSVSLLVVLS